MKPLQDIQFSMLDLVAVREGGTVADALAIAVRTAQHAESLGFCRYWLAEHHNMPGIASSATAVLVGHIAGKTRSIRVGSGGIMLPNHAPLVVAEAFGTLAELYRGASISASGGRPVPIRRPCARCAATGPRARRIFPPRGERAAATAGAAGAGAADRGDPGAGTQVPIWLLGSSLFSARLAAERGLPYAFASHFAPRQLLPALELYRSLFRPSGCSPRPMRSSVCR